MFRMHRKFQVRNGKGRDARQYLADVSEYLRDHYEVPTHAFIEVFGPDHCSHLMMDFDDLESFEAFWQRLGYDERFGAIQGREADIVIEGSVRQALLSEVRPEQAKGDG